MIYKDPQAPMNLLFKTWLGILGNHRLSQEDKAEQFIEHAQNISVVSRMLPRSMREETIVSLNRRIEDAARPTGASSAFRQFPTSVEFSEKQQERLVSICDANARSMPVFSKERKVELRRAKNWLEDIAKHRALEAAEVEHETTEPVIA